MRNVSTAMRLADEVLVWDAAAEDAAQKKANALEAQRVREAEIQKRREEIKRLSTSGS